MLKKLPGNNSYLTPVKRQIYGVMIAQSENNYFVLCYKSALTAGSKITG